MYPPTTWLLLLLLALFDVRRFLVAPCDDPTVASRSVLMERRFPGFFGFAAAAAADPDGGAEAGAPCPLSLDLLLLVGLPATACNSVKV
jgi:hypothetical protein